MCDKPYVALVAAEGDIVAIANAVAGLELVATANVVAVMTDPEMTRAGLQIDEVAVQTLVDQIMAAIEGVATEAEAFPPMIQTGAVMPEELDPLVGVAVDFTGVCVIGEAGAVQGVEMGKKKQMGKKMVAKAADDPCWDGYEMEGMKKKGKALVPNCVKIENSMAAEPAAEPAMGQQWEGILVIEGIMSGDGRKIEMNALTWRELPLPLMIMTENPVGGGGHDGARLGGRIDWIERRSDGQVWGGGVLDTESAAGLEAKRLMTPDQSGRSLLRGVSVDLDDVEMLMEEAESMEQLMDGTGTLSVAKARIMGATLTPFPAFQEAQVVLVGDVLTASLSGEDCDCVNNKSLVAAAGRPKRGAEMRVFTPFGVDALVASAAAIPVNPPMAWFKMPKLDGPTPLKVMANGRVYGHVAAWGSCHIGFKDRCVSVPKSSFRYRYFANKQTLTAEGKMVNSGPIVIDTVHPDLQMRASDAQAFYADTGCAVADVALFEDEYGIVAAGAVRPSASPEQIRKLRGSDVSPDWRTINGKLECVGLLGVNTSGFVTPALVASAMKYGGRTPRTPGKVAATMKDGKVLALVAAGMVQHSETSTIEAELEQLKSFLAPLIEERQKALAVRADVARQKLAAQGKKVRREAALARFKKKS